MFFIKISNQFFFLLCLFFSTEFQWLKKTKKSRTFVRLFWERNHSMTKKKTNTRRQRRWLRLWWWQTDKNSIKSKQRKVGRRNILVTCGRRARSQRTHSLFCCCCSEFGPSKIRIFYLSNGSCYCAYICVCVYVSWLAKFNQKK